MTPGPLVRARPPPERQHVIPLPGRPGHALSLGVLAGLAATVLTALGTLAAPVAVVAWAAACGGASWWFGRGRARLRVDRGRLVVTGTGRRQQVPLSPPGWVTVTEQPAVPGVRHLVRLEGEGGAPVVLGRYTSVEDAWRAARGAAGAAGWPLSWGALDGQPVRLPAGGTGVPLRRREPAADAPAAPPAGAVRGEDGSWALASPAGRLGVSGYLVTWHGAAHAWQVPADEVVCAFCVRSWAGTTSLAVATASRVFLAGPLPAPADWPVFLSWALRAVRTLPGAAGAPSGSPVAGAR
ncbi:MAG: hypothetical protein HY904_06575 [Deltaproteobacteria bacterium]|nr:hypothetical protein [Deltaproteobacteria bacterium]